jgi:hypothetical protein
MHPMNCQRTASPIGQTRARAARCINGSARKWPSTVSQRVGRSGAPFAALTLLAKHAR